MTNHLDRIVSVSALNIDPQPPDYQTHIQTDNPELSFVIEAWQIKFLNTWIWTVRQTGPDDGAVIACGDGVASLLDAIHEAKAALSNFRRVKPPPAPDRPRGLIARMEHLYARVEKGDLDALAWSGLMNLWGLTVALGCLIIIVLWLFS